MQCRLIANRSVCTKMRLPLLVYFSTMLGLCATFRVVGCAGMVAPAISPLPTTVAVACIGAGAAGGRLCFCHASHKKRPEAEKTTNAITLCVSMEGQKKGGKEISWRTAGQN